MVLNQQIVDELHKTIIRKFKSYSSLKENAWKADLAELQLIRKYNKIINFLLCVIDLFSKWFL